MNEILHENYLNELLVIIECWIEIIINSDVFFLSYLVLNKNWSLIYVYLITALSAEEEENKKKKTVWGIFSHAFIY